MRYDSVQVASQDQKDAWYAQKSPNPEEVLPGLWAVALPIPGEGMIFSYGYAFFEKDGVHIIDPGWHLEGNVDVWRDFLQTQGKELGAIKSIAVTHSHPDHVGLAVRLRELTGARVLLSADETWAMGGNIKTEFRDADPVRQQLEAWGVPEANKADVLRAIAEDEVATPMQPDVYIESGDQIMFGDRVIDTVYTPGHTNGHTCYISHTDGLIFTGDHVLPEINPGMGLGSDPKRDPLTDYLSSLKEIAKYDEYQVLPGHEYRFYGLALRSEEIARHHLKRTKKIYELTAELGDASVWEYASRSPWSRGWQNMTGFFLLSGLTQTELHLQSIRSGAALPWLQAEWPSHV